MDVITYSTHVGIQVYQFQYIASLMNRYVYMRRKGVATLGSIIDLTPRFYLD